MSSRPSERATPAPSEESEPDRLRLVLADDHAVVRAGLRMLLESVPGWEVVAESGDAESARRQTHGHHPDVLILDLTMPGGSSLAILPRLRSESPGTRVLMLTMEADPAIARQALAEGAAGYVLKEAAGTELVGAIRRIAAGGSYLDPALGAALAASAPPASDRPADLSGRELEVLRLIALGHTNAEIADALFLSVRTIESHRGHIQAKTGCSTRAELVTFALDAGLLDEYRHPAAAAVGA